ncbi:hypothetical protein Cpir12675_006273 [Ceratocystis pirilliformis]|uniref:Uncharacterized protein n=1 Tax=Ceratocystis pirilliformis TaxID=259994 RepID=A0ABR3YIY0_9PEZI
MKMSLRQLNDHGPNGVAMPISTDLGLLENNTDEELAQKLHTLKTEHDSLFREIRKLEERLVLLQKASLG